MIALIDCNNFFVSCELTRRPELIGHPTVVLGSNDGCVVAMSNEAKALGITRGIPLFKIKGIVQRYDVATISGDHRFYRSMSQKVMSLIRSIVPRIEVYSIDEVFMELPFSGNELADFGHYLVDTIKSTTGIPVSLGISTTRTLAKVAARFAKKHKGYNGVCIIDTDEKRILALTKSQISDVWGIGRRMSSHLTKIGISTAYQFASMPFERISAKYNLPAQRTWRELNGMPCIEKSHDAENRKSITCSRTFPHDVFNRAELYEAISNHAANAALQARKLGLMAGEISVFIATNPFHGTAQYNNEAKLKFDEPTDDTMSIIKMSHRVLNGIYREGYGYKRSGVTLSHLSNYKYSQPSLFSDHDNLSRRKNLMKVMDAINASDRYGNGIKVASMSIDSHKPNNNG
ncbi:MAG: SOS mutagenesis and repair protein UmuC [Muribaculaceae bacterium]|nr:SOS mutagenesis and repair protein UmuC [Muribaculaceae bacterium]